MKTYGIAVLAVLCIVSAVTCTAGKTGKAGVPVEVASAAKAENTPWGEAVNGLQCRVVTSKAAVPMGSKLAFELRFRRDPETADPKMHVLNSNERARSIVLRFTNKKAGRTFEREPFDVGMLTGIDEDDLADLRGRVPRPERFTVYLLSDEGEQIPPGTYSVTMGYENTAKPEVEVTVDADGLIRTRPYRGPPKFWKGKITSAPIRLTVTHVPTKEVELKTNSSLILKREKDSVSWSWSTREPTTFRAKRRPGYHLGSRYSLHVFLDGKEVQSGGGGLGGVWRDGQGASYLSERFARQALAGRKLELRADVEIFETSVPVRHMWSPEAGDLKVLWQGQVKGRLSAATAGAKRSSA